MLTLDSNRNDTSLTLDMTRAAAAQMVCVGHAINIVGHHQTAAPDLGVLLFFVLSGFVIAHTLHTKSSDPQYGLPAFALERFARIYCAYGPALLLILCIDAAMGLVIDWHGFAANLVMLQGVPGLPYSTFGTAGQITTIAVEFHIYLFVGALYFLVLGRQEVLCTIVAPIFSVMAMGYFLAIPETSRSLFVLWLVGFGAYYVLANAQRSLAAYLPLVSVGIAYATLNERVDWNNPYDLVNYPLLGICFCSLVAVSQATRWLARSIAAMRLIRFFSRYSLSLFLIHMTIIQHINAAWPEGPEFSRIALLVIVANIAAIGFAAATEWHYRAAAVWLRNALSGTYATRCSGCGLISPNLAFVTIGDERSAALCDQCVASLRSFRFLPNGRAGDW